MLELVSLHLRSLSSGRIRVGVRVPDDPHGGEHRTQDPRYADASRPQGMQSRC